MSIKEGANHELILTEEQRERLRMPFHKLMKEYSEIKAKHDAEKYIDFSEFKDNLSKIISQAGRIIATGASDFYDALKQLLSSVTGVLALLFVILCVCIVYQIFKKMYSCLRKKNKGPTLPVHSCDSKKLLQ